MNEIDVLAMYEIIMKSPYKTTAVWPSFYNTLPRIKLACRQCGMTRKQASRIVRRIATGGMNMSQAMKILFSTQ